MQTNKSSTRRSLLVSATALILSIAMLVGTTFAWFTDSASTAVNKIQSGKLDVALEMQKADGSWESAEGKTLTFKTADNRAADKILWEPGCTYELPKLRVVNKGNLALKYTVEITGINGDAKLNEVIDWTIAGITVGNTFTSLAVGANSEFTIKGHMQETAGNEYQGLTIDGIGITVFATQDTVENDSFDNMYDKNAPFIYPAGVTTESFAQATSVEYTNNLGDVVTGNKPAVAAYVDASGNVKYVGDIYAAIKSNASVIYCKKDATLRMRERLEDTNRTPDLTSDLTIYANGADFQYGQISMNMTDAGKAANVTVKVYDAKNIEVWGLTPNDGVTQNIVMENCTNIGESATGDKGILMYITGNTGTVNATVNNCHVEKNSSGIYMSTNGSLTVSDSTFVECATGIKSSYKGNGTRTDRIENCVFTKCGCTAEMAGNTDWLKNDSAAIKYKKSGTGTITLTLKSNTITGTIGDKGDTQFVDVTPVIEGPVIASNPQQANDAITNATDRNVNIAIAPGQTITLDNGIANEGAKSRDVTFVGDGSQTVDVAKNAPAAEGAKHLNYQRGSTFTFENLTIENGTDTYDGIVCDELTYKNCTIKGVTTLYGKATFINCTFENNMANQYSIWTWGGTDVTFENCTFNTNGKAILLFGEEKTTNLTVNNCTFNDRNGGNAGKAAIEIGEANYGKHNNFTVVINGSTVASGFAAGQNTGSTLWANKNSMDAEHLTVTIDGSKVQ
uniref:right-handed parallel beta-helix repeat-containing protein n=1 Tax=Gemmiger formicilis TaxID=745368 RepID=UPI003FEEC70C